MGAKGRRGRRPWGPVQERLHPRDNRGRFAKTGGSNWVEKVLSHHVAAFGDISANDPKHAIRTGDGFFDPQGGPRAGRGPGGLIDLKKLRDNASVAKSVRDYQAGVRSTPLDQIHNGHQVKIDGEWRDVYGEGLDNGKRTVFWQDRTGTTFGTLTEDTTPYVEVRSPPAFQARSGVLSAQQRRDMDAWRADAAKPAPWKAPTYADSEVRRVEGRVKEAQDALDAATKKARKEVLKRYPISDGWTRSDRERYVKQDVEDATRYEQNNLTWEREELDRARVKSANGAADDKVDPRAWPELQGDLNRERPLAVYGDLVHAHDYSQASHRALGDLETIPAEVHAIVAAAAVRAAHQKQHRDSKPGIYVGSVPIVDLDHLDDLKDMKPSGWGANDTYSMVDGVFRADTFTIAVGHTANAEHGGKSAAEHELGHALDTAVGLRRAALHNQYVIDIWENRASAQPDWQALHGRSVADAGDKMPPYFRQENGRGASELWAEAFAEWSKEYYKIMRRNRAGAGSSFDRRPDFVMGQVGRRLGRRFGITDDHLLDDLHRYFLSIADFAEAHHR